MTETKFVPDWFMDVVRKAGMQQALHDLAVLEAVQRVADNDDGTPFVFPRSVE